MAKNVTKGAETGVSRPRDIFAAMRDEMDRMLARFEHNFPSFPSLFRGGDGEGAFMVPEVDVRDARDSISIEVDLPGVEEKDVTVTLTNGVLTIKGEKRHEKEDKNENYYVAERSYGAFERSLRLPDAIDDKKVEASFDKGVLKITAAKRPEAVRSERKIEIRKAS
jgi:HSP20 family protein